MSAGSSGKPLGGQDSATNPAGGAHSAPQTLSGVDGVAAPPKNPNPLLAFGPSISALQRVILDTSLALARVCLTVIKVDCWAVVRGRYAL